MATIYELYPHQTSSVSRPFKIDHLQPAWQYHQPQTPHDLHVIKCTMQHLMMPLVCGAECTKAGCCGQHSCMHNCIASSLAVVPAWQAIAWGSVQVIIIWLRSEVIHRQTAKQGSHIIHLRGACRRWHTTQFMHGNSSIECHSIIMITIIITIIIMIYRCSGRWLGTY